MHMLEDNDAKTVSDRRKRMEENGIDIHPIRLLRRWHNLSKYLLHSKINNQGGYWFNDGIIGKKVQ